MDIQHARGLNSGGSGTFGIRGVSHLALVSSDMAATVDFYSGVLGLPLIVTIGEQRPLEDGAHADSGAEVAPGTSGLQHFFFDMGNGDTLAFFWFPNGRPSAPGIAQPDVASQVSADGSMHHLAFEISPDSLQDVWNRLEASGIRFHFIAHSIDELGAYRADNDVPFDEHRLLRRRARLAAGGAVDTLDDVGEDTFLASFYFSDPDGINLELAAWVEPAWSKAVASRNEIATRSGGRTSQPGQRNRVLNAFRDIAASSTSMRWLPSRLPSVHS
jgi:catechol 2,3-dioxygenase-like lactoylglutathione lyase family enzyme